MSMDQVLQIVRDLDGVLEVAPREGSAFPAIAWGDHFFYYAPDGQIPTREQPYATIVTKNYPDDVLCDLDRPDRWRLNIRVGTDTFIELLGEHPRSGTAAGDYTATDVVVPHPVHRGQGWVSIVNPGPRTLQLVSRLLRRAHDDARRRVARRSGSAGT